MEYQKLGEIANITKLAGFEFTKYVQYIPDGEVIAIRALNLKNGRLALDDVKRISADVSKALPRSQLRKYDIVLSYTGTVGECAQIMEDNLYHLAPNVAKVTPDTSKVNPVYLFQYIRTSEFRQKMLNYAHGSTQMTIPMKVIRELSVPVFNMDIQNSIASILASLDDKIELNTRINDNLSQQADAFYTDMFITRANPAWKKGRLSDLILVKYGKDHKKLADGKIPVFGSGGIMRYVNRALYSQESVLIPRKGTLNHVMYVSVPFWSVDTMFYTEMLRPNIAKFVYHFMRGKNLASMNAGSAVPSMTTDILNAIELLIPDDNALTTFEKIVSPMYRAMFENRKQSHILAEIRDALLPHLMSGELDVSKIDL